ncbi:MAG: hypothetical protein QOI59_4133 [Gammaproteobacteria bacterium]|jgi:hypothetical protein|nr:hypothetical protein [Gammaproteobacteria bacterium]
MKKLRALLTWLGLAASTVTGDVAAASSEPIPDEDDPMRVAAAWSLNPSTLEERHLPPSVGTIGRLAAVKRSPGE